MPQATKAEHLLVSALEIEEDEVLNKIAAKRDRKGTKFITHSSVWR